QNELDEAEPRFGMLETIREFAVECLAASGEEAAIRQEHARFFLDVAEQAEPELQGSAQAEWLNRLEQDHDNMRTALSWCQAAVGRPPSAIGGHSPGLTESREPGTDTPEEIALRLGGALWRFWHV